MASRDHLADYFVPLGMPGQGYTPDTHDKKLTHAL